MTDSDPRSHGEDNGFVNNLSPRIIGTSSIRGGAPEKTENEKKIDLNDLTKNPTTTALKEAPFRKDPFLPEEIFYTFILILFKCEPLLDIM